MTDEPVNPTPVEKPPEEKTSTEEKYYVGMWHGKRLYRCPDCGETSFRDNKTIVTHRATEHDHYEDYKY